MGFDISLCSLTWLFFWVVVERRFMPQQHCKEIKLQILTQNINLKFKFKQKSKRKLEIKHKSVKEVFKPFKRLVYFIRLIFKLFGG